MRKLTPEDQILAGGVIAGLIVLLMFHFIFLRPRIYKLRKLNPQLINLVRNVKNTERDKASLHILKKRLEDLRTKVNFYGEKLPREKEMSSLLGNLSQVAKKSDVKIVEIHPRDKEAQRSGDMYLSIPIAINAKCGYHQLGAFINELETGPRFVKIGDIKIKANPRDYRNHDVRLLLNMFVLLE